MRAIDVLARAGRVHDGGGVRRRSHAEPDVRGGVQRTHRTHRVRASALRSSRGVVRGFVGDALDVPRSDAG